MPAPHGIKGSGPPLSQFHMTVYQWLAILAAYWNHLGSFKSPYPQTREWLLMGTSCLFGVMKMF